VTFPAPLNAGDPIPHSQGQVTIVEGTTFSICGPSGDMEPGGAQGLFFRDTRIISRWQLRVDGQPPQPLSVVDSDAYEARFMARRPPSVGHADSTLLVVRERIVGEGMREVITLSNVGREATLVHLELHVDSDFADLFAVKEGHASGSATHSTASGVNLVFSRPDGSRGLLVHATGEPTSTHNGLSWQVVIPARDAWHTEIVVHPVVETRRIEPRFRERTAPGEVEAHHWRRHVTSIRVQHQELNLVLRRTVRDLDALRISTGEEPGQTFVAAGAPWFMTLFGRDSLLTSWMTLPLDPALAVGTLHTLAALQGRQVDPSTEEEPGRILHELRLGPQSASAAGSSSTSGPPTGACSTRAGRTAGTASTTPPGRSPSRRSRWPRCRGTRTRRGWPAPSSPTPSASRPWPTTAGSVPRSCAPCSPRRSGCTTRATSRWRWTGASGAWTP
jgi:glycogen debranching enzyme